EFDQLIQYIEFGNTDSTYLPFYLVGPYNVGDNVLLTTVQQSIVSNNKRIAGVAIASVDPVYAPILQAYRSRFDGAYSSAPPGSDQEENYYDAMYFAIYSLLYAGQLPTGPHAATGMQHLIDLTSMRPYSVGPGDQGAIYGILGLRSTLQLNGTLGAPNFDSVTGARHGAGDIYCFQHADAGTGYVFDYDVMRLVNADGSSPADGGSPYTGSFACFSGIQ
ncbi:MAG TPA: hypothetical protein VMI75_19260, partial [Polyangiaceae bacterium]|nr:hypothetical protein [Polyangiaceae bacterium]